MTTNAGTHAQPLKRVFTLHDRQCFKLTLSHIRTFSLPAAGIAHRRLSYTHGLKFGPQPASVARFLEVQSREDWQVATGTNSDLP